MTERRAVGVWCRWVWLAVMLVLCNGVLGDFLQVESVEYVRYRKAVSIEFENGNIEIPETGELSFEPQVENLKIGKGWYGGSELLIWGDFKPEQTYKLTISKNVKDADGNALKAPMTFRVTIPRMETSVDQGSMGVFIPVGRKNWSLPLNVQNADRVTATLYRTYPQNIVAYDMLNDIGEHNREQLRKKECQVTVPDNVKTGCQFQLEGLVPMDAPGLYTLIFEAKEKGNNRRSTEERLLVVTDLGIAACLDEARKCVQVTVNSLSESKPVNNAVIQVYSTVNTLLKEEKTDKDGRVVIDFRQTDDSRNDEPRMIMVRKDNDISFLQLKPQQFYHNLGFMSSIPTEYEHNGASELKGPAAFVYTERGAVRPGETVTVSAFIREISPAVQKVQEGFPCVASLVAPTGTVVERRKIVTGKQGFLSVPFTVAESALTGKYTVNVAIEDGKLLGSTAFLVAAYVPDNIRLEAKLNREVLKAGEELIGTLEARYYYGASVTDARVRGMFSFSWLDKPAHWEDYTAGDKENGQPVADSQRFSGKCMDGRYTTDYSWEESNPCYYPRKVQFSPTVLEDGGRGVTDTATAIVDSSDWYLGLRKEENGQEAVIRYKALASTKDAQEAFASCKAKLSLERIAWDYVTLEKDGKYVREWARTLTSFNEPFEVGLKESQGQFTIPELPDGQYRLTAEINGQPIRTVLEFWHWRGEGGQRVPDPNVMTFTTDKNEYLPGETARITFTANGNGRAIIACGDAGFQNGQALDVRQGENTVSIRIPETLRTARYYCGVTAVSSVDGGCDRTFGMAALNVNLERYRLNATVTAPEIARPGKSIDIHVALKNHEGKPVSGLAHVFLVDTGILALTRFKTPDIFGFFHGARCCSMDFRDMYEGIYPDLQIQGAVRIGGDADMAGALKDKNQVLKSKKAAVVVLDAVETDAEGKATVSAVLPEHLGAMRIMCVAADGECVGTAEQEIILRNEIDVLASGPRAVAPGDEFDLTFTLNNFDLEEGDFEFEVKLPDGLTAPKTRFSGLLRESASLTHTVRCTAGEVLGALEIPYRMTMGDCAKDGVLTVNLRSGNPPVAENAVIVLNAGEKKALRLSAQDWLAGSAKGEVTLAPSPITGLADALAWLNEYPHGCLEQTVACAFPFLCLPQLKTCGIIDDNELNAHEGKIGAAIRRINTMYLGNGTFSLWPGQKSCHVDAGIYAAHFLFACARNMEVSAELPAIQKQVIGVMRNDNNHDDVRAYCSYILSLHEKVRQDEEKACVAFARQILNNHEADTAAFFAAAALVKAGFAAEGIQALKPCLKAGVWRGDISLLHYSSEASFMGMVLSIVMDICPEAEQSAVIAAELNDILHTNGTGWGSTQANAWACMGLAEYAAFHKGETAGCTISLNDEAPRAPQKNVSRIPLKQGDVLTVANTGTLPLFLNFRQKGIRRAPVQTDSRGISIRRHYLNAEGTAVHHVKQGDLLTVRISMDSVCPMGDLVFTDLLPGGLEIEDQALATRASAAHGKKNGSNALEIQFTDRRDDRFLQYGNLQKAGKSEFTYTVRAVTRGKYSIPPTLVEAMYKPGFSGSYADDGMLIVE